MVCQALKPLLDNVPPNLFTKDPEELVAMSALAQHMRDLEPRVLHNAVRLLTGSAADFLDDYFESDMLKGYLASSSHHRHQGRTPLAGLGIWCCSITTSASTTGSLVRGPSTKAGTAASPRCWPGRRRPSAPRSSSNARWQPSSPPTEGPPVSRWRTEPRSKPTSLSAPSTPAGPSCNWSTPASCPPTSSRTSAGSASRARQPRSTSPSTASPSFRPSAIAATNTGASPTSALRSTISSGPTTRPSTGGTRPGRTSTAPFNRRSIPTWLLPEST